MTARDDQYWGGVGQREGGAGEEVPPGRGEQNQAQCVKHNTATKVSMKHRMSAVCSFSFISLTET